MNSKSFFTILITTAIASAFHGNIFNQPTNAQTSDNTPEAINSSNNYPKDRVSFYCGAIVDTETGITIPATMAYVPQRKASVSIIGWKTHIPGWDALRRCETVSPKFQTFYEQGRLGYMKTGKNNNYDIICATAGDNIPCQPEDQLFQVNGSNDPEAVLEDLTGITKRQTSSDTPIYQSSGGKTSVSIEELLNQADPIEESSLGSN